ncbi:MAG: DUF2252 domain-containing protein [Polyangiales bacterium]
MSTQAATVTHRPKMIVQRAKREPARHRAHLTPEEHVARGKAARNEVSRRSHGRWNAPPRRPDPLDLLEELAKSRVPELVPIRYGRMLVSPFAFFRGGAYIMASDLASTPRSGLQAQLCGDAHLSNFGAFASPERRMVFDINDFDETNPGPWEWDVKRLAASFEILGRDRGFSEGERRRALLSLMKSYREAMLRFAQMRDLDVWYSHLDVEALLPEVQHTVGAKQTKILERNLEKAHTKDSVKAFEKLTHLVDGHPKIAGDPPLIVPAADLLPKKKLADFEHSMRRLLRKYRTTLQPDRRVLLEHFEYQDLARKVVGVGSVGTRAWIILLLGRDEKDPLFLQCKEAQRSVLEPFVGKSTYNNHGERVVEGQRLMQAVGDIFLGWLGTKGIDGVNRDFYVRQLWDWKTSANVETISAKGLVAYARMCGWTLARAHARSGDRIAIAAYLGNGPAFDKAIADFSGEYADQNQTDYNDFKAAVKKGRLKAHNGI